MIKISEEMAQEIHDRLENLEVRAGNLLKPIEDRDPLPHPRLLPLDGSKYQQPKQKKPIIPKVNVERKSSHEIIIQQLGGRCVNCGGKDRLDKHHIVPLSRGGSDKLSNLTLLCRTCHLKVPKGSD